MDNGELQQAVIARLQALTAASFLFVGSGMSRRYIGLPSWEGLLAHFAEETPRPYTYYRSSADADLPRAASMMAADFHEVWWSDAYAHRRADAPSPAGPQSALKIEISRYLGSMRLDSPNSPAAKDPVLAEEIGLLREAVVDGVITTNYDTMLSQIFEDFRSYVGQDQLLFSDAQGIAETYYIHGSVTEPETLVLTAEDYQRFERRNAYLAAKLLTIFVEHPVLFLGYSLSDPNVTSILRAITQCLTTDNIGQLINRLIVVEWADGLAEPEMSQSAIVVDGVPIPVTQVQVSDYRPIFGALAQMRRPLPASLLRRLRDQVYQFVLNPPDEPELLQVVDIDSANAAGRQVVFGIGRFNEQEVAALGYRGVDRANIVNDILGLADVPLDAEGMLVYALPHILRGAIYTPVWKYLRKAGRIAKDGAVDVEGLDPRVVDAASRKITGLYPPEYYRRRFAGHTPIPQTPADLEAFGLVELVNCAPLLDTTGFDPQELLQALVRRMPECGRGTSRATAFNKAVCLYDLLRYGPDSGRGTEEYSTAE